jgi:phospholipase/lecithinase/hemolysin
MLAAYISNQEVGAMNASVPTSSVARRVTLFGSVVAVALLSTQALGGQSKIDRLVTFGASLSDTGNSFIWLSEPENQGCGTSLLVPPYDTLDDLVTPDGPYARGGHHFSNGATWVEGLARYLALAGNARPAFQNTGMKATNYAVGGARAVAHDCRFNLPDQVSAYLDDFPQTSARTLVAIEIGGNDVRDALFAVAASGNPADAAPIIQGALESLAFQITRLYLRGARRFLVFNVPDVGKTPAVRSIGPGAVFLAGLISTGYNAGLDNDDVTSPGVVQQLEGVFPDMSIRILDVYGTLNSVVADPATYGFSNATDACIAPGEPPYKCSQPDTYVFWDGIHPTQALHAIVAQRAISLMSAP